jgi:SAM-dependent methyltransferase
MSQAEFVERTACIGCGSQELVQLSAGLFNEAPLHDFISGDPWGESPVPYLAGKPWRYVRCASCAQAFHQHILAPDWNERRFSQWMTQAAIEAFEAPHKTAMSVFNKAVHHTRHVLQLELLTRGLRGDAPMRLLDFGCGYGEFLAMCDSYGFQTYGVDRSTAKRENGRVTEVFPELHDLQAAQLPPFHAVTLFEVLEHLDEPRPLLETLASCIVEGGILVLETPDCSGVTDIKTRDDYLKIHPLEHINGFTPETMRGLAQRLGFEPVSVPTSHVTCDPVRVAKSEVKRIIAPLMRSSTQQYFRKL